MVQFDGPCTTLYLRLHIFPSLNYFNLHNKTQKPKNLKLKILEDLDFLNNAAFLYPCTLYSTGCII